MSSKLPRHWLFPKSHSPCTASAAAAVPWSFPCSVPWSLCEHMEILTTSESRRRDLYLARAPVINFAGSLILPRVRLAARCTAHLHLSSALLRHSESNSKSVGVSIYGEWHYLFVLSRIQGN